MPLTNLRLNTVSAAYSIRLNKSSFGIRSIGKKSPLSFSLYSTFDSFLGGWLFPIFLQKYVILKTQQEQNRQAYEDV